MCTAIVCANFFVQLGQPQPDPEVAAAVGQDTLDQVKGMEYSATAQVQK